MKGDRRGRFWSWILAVPLAAFLLYWSLRGVDWKTVWHTIAGARWGFLAAWPAADLLFLFSCARCAGAFC